MNLTFLKPWKSKAKVWFELKEGNDGVTTLHWLMDSGLPIFLFWMSKSMTALIGMDYERGLSMLKDYIETGSVPSSLSMEGINNYEGCKYIGIKRGCDLSAIGTEMSKDFGKLNAWMEGNKKY